jgi:hypothetical protein
MPDQQALFRSRSRFLLYQVPFAITSGLFCLYIRALLLRYLVSFALALGLF